MKKNKIALIDGYGFVFRAFHSLPPLTNPSGTPVGAVYGFTNMLIRLLAGLDVSHISVVFDSGSKTFRNEIYSAYKANRPPCPPELIPQFPLIRKAAEALNIHISEKVGFEADDLIATIAKKVDKNQFDVLIVSSDKDLMQLIDENILMFDAMKNKIIGRNEVLEKFQVTPDKVLDVLSLMGDSSDNVPGVKGIGPKTAAELINHYGNLENLLNHLDEIKQEKRREMLKSGVENALLSKKLIALREDVPIMENVDDLILQNIDSLKLIKFLEEQGFKSLIARVKKEFQVDNDLLNQTVSNNYQTSQINIPTEKTANFDQIKKAEITDILEFKSAIAEISKSKALIFDVEFDQNNSPEILVLSGADYDFGQKIIYYIALDQNSKSDSNQIGDDLFSSKPEIKTDNNSLPISEVITILKAVLEDPGIIKISYQIKNIIKFLNQNNIKLNAFDDLAVMAYVLDSGNEKSNLRNLISTNLIEDIENNGFGVAFEEIEKGKIPEIFADFDKKKEFYFFKNYAFWQLYNLLKSRIFSDKLNLVYYLFERPLIEVLADMEMVGILVDKIKLKTLSEEFSLKIKDLTKEIYDLAGEEFNIGSPKQLAHILFEKLSLKSGKKSKSGGFSTNSEILEELDLEGQIIAGKILEWRHISKLKSTYTDALQQEINPKTNRIHSTFSNTSTSTGRLSSIDPNLQNIPIRTSEGLKIRSAFIAKKNHLLISADYSQIELRILAHMANISSLKEAFKNDKDIHAITAAQVFGVAEDQVDSNMRRKAKAINFGIIYGISAFGLARQLKISRNDAANYIKTYFETYPGIQDYMNQYQEFAKTNGFVTTIIGRKCFLPGINSNNPVIRGLAERLSINAPIQGSAADIIKKAMIDLSKNLQDQNSSAKLILQVHDELIIETPENEANQISALLKTTMENAINLSLPLKVDISSSKIWE